MGDEPGLSVRGRSIPALDGVRALAVAAVIAYHLGWGVAGGGYLGVDLFFVLSGFLITSLLVEERVQTGALGLTGFWGRRARRLLPGLAVMLLVLGAFLALAGPGPLADLGAVRADAIATVLYVANWHQLFAHQSYFARFAAPSPLQHTWSLGIEEQFYLVWPLALVGLFAAARGRWRSAGTAVAALGAACSAGWMAWLAVHGASANRLYYGTDTRAFDLLVGAALAFATAARPQPGPRARRVLAVVGPAGLVALASFWRLASGAGGVGGPPPRFMFEGGFLLAVLAGAALLADARQLAPSPLGRLLGLGPVAFVGRISYELYLFHWPVICELTEARVGVGGAELDLVRIGVTGCLSVAAYVLVDRPIRRGLLSGWPTTIRWSAAPVGMAAAAAVMVVATVPSQAAPIPAKDVTLVRGAVVPGSGGVLGGPIRLTARPTRAHPLRVILFGDSVMRGDGLAVAAALDATGVVKVIDYGFDGWGFTTDTTWRTGVPGAIEANHAALVIAMWSFDDDYLLAHPRTYRRWMTQFVHLVTGAKGVDGLIFQQFPPLGPPPVPNPEEAAGDAVARNRGVNAWNRLVTSMVSLDPHHVEYVPLAPAVERDGRYEQWMPPDDRWRLPAVDWVRVRMVDGVHFCPPGAARYADALLTDLRAAYRLPAAAPGWATGSWRKNIQFNAPGECPDDHPPD